jgi:DUF1009 family protein
VAVLVAVMRVVVEVVLVGQFAHRLRWAVLRQSWLVLVVLVIVLMMLEQMEQIVPFSGS